MIRKDEKKSCTTGDSDKQQTKRTPYKCFRFRSVDNIIVKCPKSLKDNKKRQHQVRFIERVDSALEKYSDNGNNANNQ